MTTTLDLDELERLEKAATPGPWAHYGHHTTGKLWLYGTADYANHPRIALIEEGLNYGQDVPATESANADLITAMRNALPALIAAARETERMWSMHAEYVRDALAEQARFDAAEARIKVLEADIARKDEALRLVLEVGLADEPGAATVESAIYAALSPAPQDTLSGYAEFTPITVSAQTATQDKPEMVCPDCDGEGYIREADVFNARDWSCIRCGGTGRENTQ